MGGSNLPPGVSESMIPGNRPEDLAEEEFCEKLAEALLKKDWRQEDIDDLFESDRYQAITETRDLGYVRGFNEGRAEEQMAQAMREQPED